MVAPTRGVSLILAGIVLCGCGAGAATARPTAAQSAALHIPLATAADTSGQGATTEGVSGASAWAIVPMGDLKDPSDTFWQVFVLAGAHRSWTLVTPEGVADNGGLVGSLISAGGVVGVESSGLLGFSPVAATTSGGARWTTGVLPGPLAPVPDSVAAAPGGRLLALLGASGSSVVASSDDASGTTRTISFRSALAASAARSCQLTALTAVAFGPAGQPLAAGRCEALSRLGIFELEGRSWKLVGPPVPVPALTEGVTSHQRASALRSAASRSVITQVLRLWTYGTEMAALAEAVSADGTVTLFKLTWSRGRGWTPSPVFDLPPCERLIATGEGAGGSSFVLMSRAGSLSGEELLATGRRWSKLPTPPADTATFLLESDGVTEALAVHGWTLVVYALRATGTWKRVQIVDVPAQAATPS
ncbi:MAG TPA: hypothetical protein VEH29_07210 [Acidimicrobiales bacterium]|nr:hypothetical protein [Acidimicrobiales bacterium]